MIMSNKLHYITRVGTTCKWEFSFKLQAARFGQILVAWIG